MNADNSVRQSRTEPASAAARRQDAGETRACRQAAARGDYKNWMPKGMIWSFLGGALGSAAVAVVLSLLLKGTLRTVLVVVFAALAVAFCGLTVWAVLMRRAFSYDGKRQMSRQIIEGTAAHVKLPDGGRCLDVGCGSGALAIAVAKRNPRGEIVGIDRWGKEYASFSKNLCEGNARAEGVKNASFRQGDATHLEFADETFDAVVSNYVYHNIPGNRQEYLLETRLRAARHLFQIEVRRHAGVRAKAEGHGLSEGRADRHHRRHVHDEVRGRLDGAERIGAADGHQVRNSL